MSLRQLQITGTLTPDVTGDLTGNGCVGLADLLILSENWLREVDMSYPDKVTLTSTDPTFDPAEAKDVVLPQTAEYNGKPLYSVGSDFDPPKWTLYWNIGDSRWVYVYSPDGFADFGWGRQDESPVGEYIAGTGTGTATVEA